MNEEARAELDRIVAMEPEALTPGEKDFLAARRADLSEEQQNKFGLNEVVEPKKKTKADQE